jgi:hypothetical protein
MLSTSYNILFNILLPRDYQCVFQSKRSTTDQIIFFLRSPDIGEEWEYNETVISAIHRLQENYDSVRRGIFYIILI